MLKKNIWLYLRYVMFALLTVSVSVGVISCDTDPLAGTVSPVDDDDPDPLDPPVNGGDNQ